MLPLQPELKNSIKNIVTSNPYAEADNPADADKAVDYFCNQLATLLLDMLKNDAQVIHMVGAIKTVVTTNTGAGTGYNVVPITGKLQ